MTVIEPRLCSSQSISVVTDLSERFVVGYDDDDDDDDRYLKYKYGDSS
jgi:hypothetical protein